MHIGEQIRFFLILKKGKCCLESVVGVARRLPSLTFFLAPSCENGGSFARMVAYACFYIRVIFPGTLYNFLTPLDI